MRVEGRRFNKGTPGETRQLILVPETEAEAEAIDFYLGEQKTTPEALTVTPMPPRTNQCLYY